MSDKRKQFSIPAQMPYAPAIGVPTGLPKEIVLAKAMDGTPTKTVPVFYFNKDILRTGFYRHPIDEWEKTWTRDGLDELVEAFGRMKAHGVRVPFIVDHSSDADDGRGQVIELRRENDNLIALISVVGEDAALQLARVPEVSVEISEDVVDGQGRKYGEAIEAVSHSQFPIVPNQRPFVPIAASRRRAGSTLCAANRSKTMSLKPDLKAQLAALAVQNGKPVEDVAAMSDDDLAAWYIEFAIGSAPDEEQVAEMDRVKQENANLQTQVQTLSRKLADKPVEKPQNEEVLHERGIRVRGRVEQLVSEHKIDKATADKLLSRLTKHDGKPNAFMLSRHGDAGDCEAVELLEILAGNNPPPKGEKTGVQVRELSRNVPNESNDDNTPEKQVEAGRKEGEAHQQRQLQRRGLAKSA